MKYLCKDILIALEINTRVLERVNAKKPDEDLKLAINNLDKAGLYLRNYIEKNKFAIERLSSESEDIPEEFRHFDVGKCLL